MKFAGRSYNESGAVSRALGGLQKAVMSWTPIYTRVVCSTYQSILIISGLGDYAAAPYMR